MRVQLENYTTQQRHAAGSWQLAVSQFTHVTLFSTHDEAWVALFIRRRRWQLIRTRWWRPCLVFLEARLVGRHHRFDLHARSLPTRALHHLQRFSHQVAQVLVSHLLVIYAVAQILSP